jgi:hypothetical protein
MTAVAWPGAALIFGVFFVLVFRPHIGRFLDRTKSVGKEGLRAYDEAQSQQLTTKPDALTQFLDFKAKHLAGSIDGGRSPAMPARAEWKNEEPLTGSTGVILQ